MIKATVILFAALVVTSCLRHRAAAERHGVWAAAILSAGLLPLIALILPSWEPVLAQRVVHALPAVSTTLGYHDLSNGPEVVFHADGIEPPVSALSRVAYDIWLAGSIVGLLAFAAGIYRQRRYASRSYLLTEPGIIRIAADIAKELNCRRTVHLHQSVDPSMPMTWGVVRPQLLLPNSVSAWSDDRKRVVIAHELSHVVRMDWLFQTIARVACAIYWFNPLFWIACNRLYRESEQACDDRVINLGVKPGDYASLLLDIARNLRSDILWSTTLAMAKRSALEKRFAALLEPDQNRRAATPRTFVLIATATLSLVLPLAAMRVIPGINENLAPDSASVPLAVEQYTVPPLYSDEARQRGIEGIVTVEVRVDSHGNVDGLRVVKGLGYGLDQNALLAVRDWRFVPARRSGIPVNATTQIDVEFNLRTAELNELIANDMATRLGPGVSAPQVVHRVEPQYRHTQTRNTPAGAVVLDAVILEDGTPKVLRVIQSLDWEFDEAAINALKQWRFSPAMKEGNPVRVRTNVAVSFGSI